MRKNSIMTTKTPTSHTLHIYVFLIFLTLCAQIYPPQIEALDSPHNSVVNCSVCHPVHEPLPPTWWTDQGTSGGICGQCHNPSSGLDDAVSHDLSARFGSMSIQCSTCHDPHYQRQLRTWKPASFLLTGTIKSVDTYGGMWIESASQLTPGAYAGMLLVPDTASVRYNYRIADNTTNIITIDPAFGTLNLASAQVGKTFGISYGKLIRQSLYGKSVKFFNKSGSNSFADDDAVIDGVCQVCHTRTTVFNQSGALNGGSHPANKAGTNCTECHSHTSSSGGFRTNCQACHGNPPTVDSVGGPGGLAYNEGGTNAATAGAHQKHAVTIAYPCDTCHTGGMPVSPAYDKKIQIGFSIFGGAFQSGTYDGRGSLNGYAYEAGNAGTSITQNGAMSCSSIYCHSNANPLGGTNKYQSPAWNGAATTCGSCHSQPADATRTWSLSHDKHVVAYGAANGGNFTCNNCHADTDSYGVLRLHMDEASWNGTSGEVKDSSGNGNNGIAYNGATTAANGISGRAGSFDGTGSVSLPISASLSITGPLSISAWVNFNVLGKGAIITAGGQYTIWFTSNGAVNPGYQIVFRDNRGNGVVTTTADLTTGTWYHIAGVFSGITGDTVTTANTQVYINGVAQGATTNGAWSPVSSPSSVTVGSSFNGLIDEVIIYNRTLSSSEIQDLYLRTQRTINYSTHVNGRKDVAGNALASANGVMTYNSSSHQCSSAYCHGNYPGSGKNATPAWGNASGVTCGSCHGASSAAVPSSGSHARHTDGISHDRKYACTLCHNGIVGGSDTAYSIADKAKHVNGAVDWQFDSTYSLIRPNPAYTYTAEYSIASGANLPSDGTSRAYGTCKVYCHSDVQGADGNGQGPPANYNNTLTWGTPAGGHLGTGGWACGACHKAGVWGDPSTNKITSGSHGKHSTSCQGCHYRIAYTAGSGCAGCHGENRHVNGLVDVVFGNLPAFLNAKYKGNNNGGYLPGSGYGSCSDIYCHTDGTSVSTGAVVFNTTPTWGSSFLSCNSCHGTSTTDGLPDYVNGSPKANSHDTHSRHACDKCHSAVGMQCGDKVYNVSSYTFSTSGGTCSNISCHQGGLAATATAKWGSSLACTDCHGSTATYTNYRSAAPQYASSYTKANAHVFHVDVRDESADGSTGTGTQCKHCHNTTSSDNINITNHDVHGDGLYTVSGGTSTFRKWSDGSGTVSAVTMIYSSTSCSNVSCHPAPSYAQSIPWREGQGSYTSCTVCHYFEYSGHRHFIWSNGTVDYPTTIPEGSSINSLSRKCTMCHVDHNIFSPKLNTAPSAVRSMNLRTDISVVPDKTSGYINTDFDNNLPKGGICVSCHFAQREKDYGLQTLEDTYLKSTKTPTIGTTAFNSSAHNYAVTSTMTSGGSFGANCSKCHSGSIGTTTFQNSGSKFNTHYSPFRRLLSSMGMSSPSDPLEENFCFRCHSRSTDTNPGGGPAKTAAGKDYYNVANMREAAEHLFSTFPASTTTDTLYFKPLGEEGPSEPMPNDSSKSMSNPAGGPWINRSMSPGEPVIDYEIKSQVTNISSQRYWRMISFISLPVAKAVSIPKANWTLNFHCQTSDVNQHAKIYYRLYRWGRNDQAQTAWPPLSASGTIAAECGTASSLQSITFTPVFASSLALGEKIGLDLYLETNAQDTTERTASFMFGKGAVGSLTLPVNVTFAPVKGGHQISAYSGGHRPLPVDDMLSYPSGFGPGYPMSFNPNRHVECEDCHNTHSAGTTTHVRGTNAVSSVLNEVSGSAVNYTTSNATLYFRNTEPAEPAPNTSANTIDPLQGEHGGMKEMQIDQTPLYAMTNKFVSIQNPGYWKMMSFVSPPAATTMTVDPGQWTVALSTALNNNTPAVAYLRYHIYIWRRADAKGPVIVAPTTNEAVSLTYTKTEIVSTFGGSGFVLYPGDRIVVELSADWRSGDSNYVVVYWNDPASYNGRIIMPSAVPFVSYTSVTASKEYELCFRCHSGANGNVTWGPYEGPSAWTDPGLEFNPVNKSAHPVLRTLNEQLISPLPSDRLLAPWNANPGNQTMYCSDCHSADSASSSGGAHNSVIKWMLSGTNKSWPYQGTASNGMSASTGTYWTLGNSGTNAGTANGLFCLNCHLVINMNAVHTDPANSNIACVSCHIRVPHGGKVSRLINTNTGGRVPRYSPDGNGGGFLNYNDFNGEIW